MTTYGEWTQSRCRRRHSSSPLREEAVPSVIKSPRSKSSSKDGSHQASSGSGLQSRGRPRTKRNSNATQQNQQPQQVAADPQHYLRIHQHSSSANTTQLQPQPPDGATGLGSRLSHHHGHHVHHEVNVLSQVQQQQRMEHSRSPSDGMILTASGLSGLLSNSGVGGHNHSRNTTILQQAQNNGNNSENHNSNQVVIVDGLNNDEDVYLTTS